MAVRSASTASIINELHTGMMKESVLPNFFSVEDCPFVPTLVMFHSVTGDPSALVACSVSGLLAKN